MRHRSPACPHLAQAPALLHSIFVLLECKRNTSEQPTRKAWAGRGYWPFHCELRNCICAAAVSHLRRDGARTAPSVWEHTSMEEEVTGCCFFPWWILVCKSLSQECRHCSCCRLWVFSPLCIHFPTVIKAQPRCGGWRPRLCVPLTRRHLPPPHALLFLEPPWTPALCLHSSPLAVSHQNKLPLSAVSHLVARKMAKPFSFLARWPTL